MAAKIENNFGEIIISNSVIANIAGAVANNCYGVVGMAVRNTKDGIVNLLKAGSLSKGIKVEVEEGAIVIDMHIMVQYGVNISAICESIMHNVSYQVALMTGFEVKAVNVHVEGMRVDE